MIVSMVSGASRGTIKIVSVMACTEYSASWSRKPSSYGNLKDSEQAECERCGSEIGSRLSALCISLNAVVLGMRNWAIARLLRRLITISSEYQKCIS